MLKSIILAFSLHLLGVLGNRASDLLPNCNWVYDENPDDGTFAGWYAINLDTPESYCNSYTIYDTQDPPQLMTFQGDEGPSFGVMSWYYECNQTTNAVDKYMCLDDLTCAGSCFWRNEISDTAFFNCDESVTESCLMEYGTFVNTVNTGACEPDTSQQATKTYGVNGACMNVTGDEGGESFGLYSCNDEIVQMEDGTSHGISIEYYVDPDCTVKDEDRGIQEMTTGECSAGGSPMIFDRRNYMGDVVTCDGFVRHSNSSDDDGPEINGMIDGLYPDCEICSSPCLEQGNNTIGSMFCESFGDQIFMYECGVTAEKLYNYTGFMCDMYEMQASFYLDGTMTCDEMGIPAFVDCILENDCFGILPEGYFDDMGDGGDGGDDNNCGELCIFHSDCIGDSTCAASYEAIDYKQGGSMTFFQDIHTYCALDGNDCTVLMERLQCALECPSDDDGSDGDDFCPAVTEAQQYGCFLDADCLTQYQAVVMPFFGMCDESFCSPTSFAALKATECSEPTTCGSLFEALYAAYYGCFMEDCVWATCTTEIDACAADSVCMEQLGFVSSIQDNYDIADNQAVDQLIYEWYCSGLDGGACDEKLVAAFECVTTNECNEYDNTNCVAVNCATEITACQMNDECLNTFLDAAKNETACKSEVGDMYGCDCDNLPTECFQCVDPMCDTVEMCEMQCGDCGEVFMDLGFEECGGGACGGNYGDLLLCNVENCMETTGADCHASCIADMIPCMFSMECAPDWAWVENYFDDFDTRITNFEYPSVSTMEGCTPADVTGYLGAVIAGGEDVPEMASLFACHYKDILEYCGNETSNADGCPAEFYAPLNCNFGCFGVIDTVAPTAAPTMGTVAPTATPTTAAPTTAAPTTSPTTTTVVAEETEAASVDSSSSSWNVMPLVAVCALSSYLFY